MLCTNPNISIDEPSRLVHTALLKYLDFDCTCLFEQHSTKKRRKRKDLINVYL